MVHDLYDVIPNEFETTSVSFKSIPFPGFLTFDGARKQLNYLMVKAS
jgi:hypothetical protein